MKSIMENDTLVFELDGHVISGKVERNSGGVLVVSHYPVFETIQRAQWYQVYPPRDKKYE